MSLEMLPFCVWCLLVGVISYMFALKTLPRFQNFSQIIYWLKPAPWKDPQTFKKVASYKMYS
jgi:hypothetical protein